MHRARFWIETALAVSSTALASFAIAWPEWIEAVFGVDPDHGSGALEWLIALVLLAISITFSLLARRDYRAAASET